MTLAKWQQVKKSLRSGDAGVRKAEGAGGGRTRIDQTGWGQEVLRFAWENNYFEKVLLVFALYPGAN